MKYNIFSFRESDDYDKKRYGFAESPDSVDPIDIYQGLPLEKPWSEPMFELTEGHFSDYLSNDCDWVLCSEKLKQCIETNAINATDITWCSVAVNDGDVVKTYYALLMETPMKEILDIEKSRKLRDGKIYLPHFVYDKIKDVDIFALEEEYLGGLYISERLKLIIEAENLAGVGFEDWYAS